MKKSLAALCAVIAGLAAFTGCSKKSGAKWIVATDTVFRPFEYTNENNEFVGIDVDILAAVAKDQGFEYPDLLIG